MALSLATLLLAALVLCPVIYTVTMATVWIRKQKRIGVEVDKLPGLDKHWLMGWTLHHFKGFGETGIQWVRSLNRRFPRISRFWVSPFHPFVAMLHPETIKAVMKTSEPKQLTSMSAYRILKAWLGEGLLISDGEKWFRNRRLLTPAFHFDVLKPYMIVNNQATDILLDKWSKPAREGKSKEIYQDVCLLTLNIMLRCAFSYDIDVQKQGESHPYVKAVNRISRLLMERIVNPFMYSDFIYSLTPSGREFKKHLKLLHDTTMDLIAKRRQSLVKMRYITAQTSAKYCLEENAGEDPQKRYLDFLDILLLAKDEDGTGLTEQEIKDEADTFLFEGHDTTGSAISWTLYSLAKHQDIQEKCRAEIQEVLQDREYVEWDDLQKIPYITMCIKESLRFHSPVPSVGRQLTSKLTVDGVTLLPGTMVNTSIHSMHHNPQVWGEDHDEFIPERFEPDKIEKMHPYAFVPFSAGPRNCIGQNFAMHEIKVVICRILHRFRLRVDPSHKVGHQLELVMRSENGIKLFMEPLQ